MIAIFITIILIVVIVVERFSDKVDRFLPEWMYSRVADEAKMETTVFSTVVQLLLPQFSILKYYLTDVIYLIFLNLPYTVCNKRFPNRLTAKLSNW